MDSQEKRIDFYIPSSETDRFYKLLSAPKIREIIGDFKIVVSGEVPIFMPQQQVKDLTQAGVSLLEPWSYRIYFNPDISKKVERHGGVELPTNLLEDETKFCESVLERIVKMIK